jgi:metal-responsive CopG/Arc/MetJ family transcriptional regulator
MRAEYDFSKGRRGPVIPVPRGKTRITIRLDKDLIEWFRSQVEAAGGGNYQTLINSALREYVREASSRIAEDTARYGRYSVIDELGPMDSKPGARWRQAKRRPGRAARTRRDARVISVPVEKELLARSDDLAKSLRTDRAGLIERGLKAVLAVAGRK